MSQNNEAHPYVLANTNNHVLWLSMNRPKERNPLSSAMLRALYAHIREASENDDIRVIVITGEGAFFQQAMI